jgi:hypothetical protein
VFVTIPPEALAASAGTLRGVGFAMNAGNAAAATRRDVPGNECAGPAILRQLVDVLTVSSGLCTGTEAANAGAAR